MILLFRFIGRVIDLIRILGNQLKVSSGRLSWEIWVAFFKLIYQAPLVIMAAGAYGLPQFCLPILWGLCLLRSCLNFHSQLMMYCEGVIPFEFEVRN
ncbi:hypothetical protein ACSQ67_002094 [Phaseolus vulgaris]